MRNEQLRVGFIVPIPTRSAESPPVLAPFYFLAGIPSPASHASPPSHMPRVAERLNRAAIQRSGPFHLLPKLHSIKPTTPATSTPAEANSQVNHFIHQGWIFRSMQSRRAVM